MSDDANDFIPILRQRRIQTKLNQFEGFREWHKETFGQYPDKNDVGGLQAFSLRGTTAKQEQALRGLAKEYGFDDMRGFNKFMEGAHVDYYDLIKVASP